MARGTAILRQSGRSNWLLLVAVLSAVVAGLLVYLALERSAGDGTAAPAGDVTVMVAAQSIPAQTRITEDMVEERQVPENLALGAAFSSTEGLVGSVTRFPVAQGEQVLRSDLVSADVATGGLAASVPEGMRALSIGVSEVIGSGGLIQPGNYVDVILVAEVEPVDEEGNILEGKATREVAVTVLQDVRVLAVAQEVGPDEKREEDDPDANPQARSVTLAVTQEEAQKLFLAEEVGSLRLSLRSVGDHETEPVPPLSDDVAELLAR